jgi:hypothetical protein
MNVLNIFDTNVISFICKDKSLFKNNEFQKELNILFNLDVVVNNQDLYQKGKALTTCALPLGAILDMPSIPRLTEWIIEHIMLARYKICEGKYNPDDVKGVMIRRAWTNRMFKDCQGICHRHEIPSLDGVAIFYVDAPENSAKLVFIKDGKDQTFYKDYSEDNRVYLLPEEGQLVIHSPDIVHCVTEHNSDLPRTCLIFDFQYLTE